MFTKEENKSELTSSGKNLPAAARTIAPVICPLLVTFMSVLVLTGWAFDIDFLKSIIPGYVFMNPVTAATFILSSISLLLLKSAHAKLIYAARVCAATVAFVGLEKLGSIFGFFNFAVDQILFAEQLFDKATGRVNQMTPQTALNFLFIGFALLLLDAGGKRWRNLFVSQYFAVAAVLSSFSAIVGYIYGVKSFYLVASFNVMAIHSGISFLLLGVGLLLSKPEQGIVKEIFSGCAGGEMARRLFLLISIIPVALGWLYLKAGQLEIMGKEIGVAVLVVAISIILGSIILSNARLMNIASARRRRIESELSASKTLLTKFVAHTPAAVAMLDNDLRYLQISERWLQDYKLVGQDIIGKSHYEVFPDVSDEWREVHRRCLAGAVEKRDEDAFPRADGTVDWLQWETRPWTKADGEIGGLIFFTQLITERKQTEELMRQSEEKYRNILASIEEGYFETDLKGNLTFFNEALCSILGYDKEELQGMSYRRYVDDANGKKLFANLVNIFKTGQPVSRLDWEISSKNDARRFVESSMSLIRDRFGKAIGFRGLVRDVTDRKRAELETQVISEIIQGVTTTSNLDQLLIIIYQSIKKVLSAENCYVALYDKKTELLNLKFFVDKYDTACPPFKLGKQKTAYVFRHGRPILMDRETVRNLTAQGELELIGTPPAVWLGVPLRTPSEITGVLVVQHYEDENAYSPRDLDFLASVGDQIAMAIERKRVEEAVQNSRDHLAQIINAVPDPIFVKDRNHQFVLINAAMCQMMGQSCETLTGKSDYDFFSDEEAAVFWAKDEKVFITGEEDINEETLTDAHGNSRTIITRKGLYIDKNGEPFIVGVIRDISDRKRVEEVLETAAQKERAMIENALDVICSIDAEGRFASVSPACFKVWGYHPEELINRKYIELVVPEDVPQTDEVAQAIMSGEKAVNFENRYTHKNGSPVDVLWVAYWSEAEQLMFCVAHDNTERKRMEDELKTSERTLAEAQQIAGIGSFQYDFLTGLVKWSDELWRIFGLEKRELGLNLEEFVERAHPDDRAFVAATLETLQREQKITDFHHRIVRPDGTIRVVNTNGKLIYNQDGKPVKINGIHQDITEQTEMEEQLRSAHDAALESARLKSEFLANMSHEIRTPMNGVIGMTGLLLDTELNPEQREYAETIESSADGLLRIIDDILDFSKIEAGRLHFERIDFDLNDTVEGAVEMLAERAAVKGIEIASLVESDVPASLKGDPGRLRQILTNLIGNAVKFTAAGEVTVTVRRECDDGKNVGLRFEVRDTGIGVTEEQGRKLFRAFVQADGTTTRKYGGTGLGLAISKQLAEMMGGEIGVESESGAGSTFWFTARFETQPAPPKPEQIVNFLSLEERRVLIVDDNQTNRKIFVHQTTAWGMRATEAESGAQALELLRKAAAENAPFEIAILDLMMPEMDGFQTAEAIKADSSICGTRLILLPSYGKRGHGQLAREAQIAAYLQKPVRQSQLYNCLLSVIGEPAENSNGDRLPSLITQHSLRAKPAAAQQKIEKSVGSIRILIAEDNPVNRRVAVSQLKSLGYAAEVAHNGREAVEAIKKSSYNVVLMDCQMPEMDGFEATHEIRNFENGTKHTTIIAMTAHALEGEREKCLAAGMDDYISKPVKIELLRQMLDKWISPESKIAEEPAICEVA